MLLRDLAQDAKDLNVERINSTMLFKALLEADESPLYNAILSLVDDITFFPDMIEETYDYIPVKMTDIKNEVEVEAETIAENEEEILNENRESLELFVEALMRNGIVGPKDLKQILKNIKKM